MLKINGREILRRDDVGEIPHRPRGPLVLAACEAFLISRGLETDFKFNTAKFGRRRKDRKRH